MKYHTPDGKPRPNMEDDGILLVRRGGYRVTSHAALLNTEQKHAVHRHLTYRLLMENHHNHKLQLAIQNDSELTEYYAGLEHAFKVEEQGHKNKTTFQMTCKEPSTSLMTEPNWTTNCNPYKFFHTTSVIPT